MQLSQMGHKNHVHLFSMQNIRKVPQKAHQFSPRKIQKRSSVNNRLSTSISSCLEKRKAPQNSLKHTNSLSTNKSESIPSKVYDYHEMVSKKVCLLRRKHNVTNSRNPFPNLLDINQSVKDDQQSFARCMNRELDSTGNANLLSYLRRDVPLEKRNYLKEACRRMKMERKCLRQVKEEVKDSIVLPPLLDTCQSNKN